MNTYEEKIWESVGQTGAEKYAAILEYEAYKSGRTKLGGQDDFCVISEEGYVEFNYHAGQSAVMSSDARFIIALAGRQGGKSAIAAPWLYNEMRSRGPGLYMVVAPSFPILFDSVYPKIVDFFQHKLNLGEPRSKPFSFIISKEGERELYEGTVFEHIPDKPQTVIRFCHAQDAASLEAKTALACVFDEAGQDSVKTEAFEAIEGRLTTTQGRLLLTTTPYAINSLFSRYYKPWEDAKNKGKKHKFIEVVQFKSTMNPRFLPEEYERLRATMPDWRFRMFYNGEFTRPAGQIYSCFDDEEMSPDNCTSNVVTPFPIPAEWPRYTGHDFGGSNTSCIWFAEDPATGFLYLYRAYLAGERTAEDHLSYILNPRAGSGNLTMKTAWSSDDRPDRSMGGSSGEGSFRAEYKRAGLYIEEPIYRDRGSVELGIDIVYGLLSSRRLKVFSDQVEFIQNVKDYSREIDPETGEVILGTIVDKGKWHLLDALRYGAQLVSRNWLPDTTNVAGQLGMDPRYEQDGKKLLQGAMTMTMGSAPHAMSEEDWESMPPNMRARAIKGGTGMVYQPESASISSDGGADLGFLLFPKLSPPTFYGH